MPYVKVTTDRVGMHRRTAEITTSDPKIMAAWVMEQFAVLRDHRDRMEIMILPVVIQTGTGRDDYVTDWPQGEPIPFAVVAGDVPPRAFVSGLRAALEAFLETL